MWFVENAWIAEWTTAFFVISAEATILYLLFRYLRGFLGGLSPLQMKLLQWKFSTLVTMTTAEKIRLKEDNEALYNEYCRKLEEKQ